MACRWAAGSASRCATWPASPTSSARATCQARARGARHRGDRGAGPRAERPGRPHRRAAGRRAGRRRRPVPPAADARSPRCGSTPRPSPTPSWPRACRSTSRRCSAPSTRSSPRPAGRCAPTCRRRCDAAATVRDRVAFWQALAEDQGRPMRVVVPAGPLPVPLAADDLTDVVDVLVDNVFAHTPEGTAFAVSCSSPDGRRVRSWSTTTVPASGRSGAERPAAAAPGSASTSSGGRRPRAAAGSARPRAERPRAGGPGSRSGCRCRRATDVAPHARAQSSSGSSSPSSSSSSLVVVVSVVVVVVVPWSSSSRVVVVAARSSSARSRHRTGRRSTRPHRRRTSVPVQGSTTVWTTSVTQASPCWTAGRLAGSPVEPGRACRCSGTSGPGRRVVADGSVGRGLRRRPRRRDDSGRHAAPAEAEDGRRRRRSRVELSFMPTMLLPAALWARRGNVKTSSRAPMTWS